VFFGATVGDKGTTAVAAGVSRAAAGLGGTTAVVKPADKASAAAEFFRGAVTVTGCAMAGFDAAELDAVFINHHCMLKLQGQLAKGTHLW